MFSWLYMTFIKTQVFFKESHFQVCIFPRFIRIDFPNYVPLHPGIDYLCGKCFISLPPKVRKNPGNVGQFQAAFYIEVLYKCNQFLYVLWYEKYMKHCVAATHSIDTFCPCFFSVVFVSTNSELAKTQGLH